MFVESDYMSMIVKSKSKFHNSRKTMILATLLIILLISSLLVTCAVMMTSKNTPTQETNEDDTPINGDTLTPETALTQDISTGSAIHVSSEDELVDAINKTTKSITITLDCDIILSRALAIPANKDITLTSTNNNNINFFKLIGANQESTILVNSRGVLRLAGVIVTHGTGYRGSGVDVESDGKLIMSKGEISGNSASMFLPVIGDFCSMGGGVYNNGVFEMYGGVISNNNAQDGFGGGVYNGGTFSMYSGVISGNTFGRYGGVYNSGTFSMSGGEISNNSALSNQNLSFGGGVYNSGTFSMSGGKISNNKATNGGGVHVNTGNVHADGTCDGSFSMSGGEISGNTAVNMGGGVCYMMDTFNHTSGVISGNTATEGKDVYNKKDHNW